ncbi:MAG: hypothetical protein AB8G22_18375 [Saprospiraceae bacterium]
METLLVDGLGWIGSILLIAAYVLVSKNKITAQQSVYQLLNLFGSLLLIVNTVYYGAYPSAAVNVIWVFIGLFFFIKIAQKN